MIHAEKSSNPFSSEIQLQKFYSNPLIDQFYSVLINSIGGKDFLILVIGESKSGKTTFLSKLVTQFGTNVKPCHIKIRESDDPTAKDIKHPAFLYKNENSQVIILDDAHQLNIPKLSIILKNAWDIDEDTNQFILFCEPQISNLLSSLLKKMPKKASVNKLYIPNLDKSQTESYLNHYLNESNMIARFSFSKLNIKNIYKKSKGLPGKVNLEAGKIFSKKIIPLKINKKSKTLFSPVLISIIIFLFLITITGFILLKKNKAPSSLSSNKITSGLNTNTIIKKIPDDIKNDKTDNIQKSGHAISITETITETNIPTSSNKAFSRTVTSKPEPVLTKSQIKPTPTIAKTQKKIPIKTNKKSSIFQENWIMIQEPQLYTIQVMAAKEKDSLKRFLKLNKNNQNEVAYYKMVSKDGIWYKFISGKFETFEKAKAASYELPEELQKLRPWPRQFASIQNDIDIGLLNSKQQQ
jgi:DamX protein